MVHLLTRVRPLNPLSVNDTAAWEMTSNSLKVMEGVAKRGAKEEWVFGQCLLTRPSAAQRATRLNLWSSSFRSCRERIGQQGDLRDGSEGSRPVRPLRLALYSTPATLKLTSAVLGPHPSQFSNGGIQRCSLRIRTDCVSELDPAEMLPTLWLTLCLLTCDPRQIRKDVHLDGKQVRTRGHSSCNRGQSAWLASVRLGDGADCGHPFTSPGRVRVHPQELEARVSPSSVLPRDLQ